MEYPYNLDYAKKLVINTNEKEWVPSSLPGVDRCMLERESVEAGITTSVVTYAPNSHFPAHTHPKGEEIFVLEGVFSDENGDYEAGTYIRNPAGSSHSPFSKEGCKLFVKLNQFLAADDQPIAINTNKQEWLQGHGELKVMPLSSFGTTGTALVKWPPGARFTPHNHFRGEEIFVLSGTFIDEHGRYPAGTWIRSPHMSSHNPYTDEGCIIFVKTGHLSD